MAKVIRRIFGGLFILALIGLYIIIYAVPGVTGALTQTEILEYGNLRISNEVTVYFVRSETVYSAAHAGTINYFFPDGIQVRTGTRILNITYEVQEADAESQFAEIMARLDGYDERLLDFVTQFNGVTSFFIDGFENMFTPENMRNLRYEQISQLNLTPVNVVRERTLRGEPLFKISNHRLWHILAWVDAGYFGSYPIGRNVTIELPNGQINASVIDVIADGEKWLVIFETNRHYPDFARVRYAPATIVAADQSGLIVRNESITVRDGVIGVYARTRGGRFTFRPIRILASDGENSLVSIAFFYNSEGARVTTVNLHDEIMRRPAPEVISD